MQKEGERLKKEGKYTKRQRTADTPEEKQSQLKKRKVLETKRVGER